jgi:hypothetical protein
MGPHFWDPDDILTAEENASLEKPFSEEEIKQAVFESYASGAPCPDSLSFLFYQKYWDLIKNVFLALVRDFESGDLNVSILNYAIISLIPKEPDVKEMKKFRPISLGNCSLKNISKAITNRIAPIGDRIIASNQTAFIKRRCILESVVAAQELIHVAHISGRGALVLKLDFEKAYDRVDWSFLDEILLSRGFDPTIRSWIKSLLIGGSSCVRVNDTNGPYFRAGRGLKQGDSSSPILFNLVEDVFTKMLAKAASASLICGLLPQVVPGGIITI